MTRRALPALLLALWVALGAWAIVSYRGGGAAADLGRRIADGAVCAYGLVGFAILVLLLAEPGARKGG